MRDYLSRYFKLFQVDPCAAATSGRAENLCHAPRHRRIFCGSAEFQPKMIILSASRIFIGAISALTKIQLIVTFHSPNKVEYANTMHYLFVLRFFYRSIFAWQRL